MKKMREFLKQWWTRLIIVVVIVVGAIIFFRNSDATPDWTTDTVTRGTVSNIISVSGTIDAENTAELAFPVSGVLGSLLVKEGNVVAKGQVLATLSQGDLLADYRDAEAQLLIAEADHSELVNGLRIEEYDVAETTVRIAEEDLARAIAEHDERVRSVYRTLLSDDLEARPGKKADDAIPPAISGTYACSEGTYMLDVFGSNAQSGYSYKLSGLEHGTYTAYTESPSAFGTCGLSIQFTEGETYSNSSWIIEIPNTQSTEYVANHNAYNLAVTEGTNVIREAEQKLLLAEQNRTLDIADPREEALTRASAKVLQAQARVALIGAKLADRTLTAPFDGTITSVEPVVGEAVGTTPIITMVSGDSFVLTALIPEIDVTKVSARQKADIVFDARQNETLSATLVFISPLAKEIDGVSYFEAKLTLDNEIDWLRSGLNADIDVIVERHENVLRIPKRYLVEENGTHTVFTPSGDIKVVTPVTRGFVGNDGFVEVRDIPEGTTIIAP